MKKSTNLLALSLVTVLLVVFGYTWQATAQTAATIQCTVSNDSGFQNTYELFDTVANSGLPMMTIAAHGTAVLTLKSNQALTDGYGSFRSKKTDSSTWNNFSQIRNGEKRSLN
jgi:hypothetical protein